MRRRPRQLSVKECYEILKLDKGAELQAVAPLSSIRI